MLIAGSCNFAIIDTTPHLDSRGCAVSIECELVSPAFKEPAEHSSFIQHNLLRKRRYIELFPLNHSGVMDRYHAKVSIRRRIEYAVILNFLMGKTSMEFKIVKYTKGISGGDILCVLKRSREASTPWGLSWSHGQIVGPWSEWVDHAHIAIPIVWRVTSPPYFSSSWMYLQGWHLIDFSSAFWGRDSICESRARLHVVRHWRGCVVLAGLSGRDHVDDALSRPNKLPTLVKNLLTPRYHSIHSLSLLEMWLHHSRV